MKRLNRENTNTPEWWEQYYSMKLNKKPTRRRTEEHYKWLLNYMDKGSVLDVGCGQGWGSNLIKKNKPVLKVYGIDISPVAIKFGRKNFENVCFMQGDFTSKEEQYYEEPFDYVLLLEILEHLEKPFELLDYCLTITNKRLFISVPYRPTGKDPETTHINIFDLKDFRDRYENVCLTGVDGHLKIMIDKTYDFQKWKAIKGWLRDAEGEFLEKLCRLAPIGKAVELGAYHGRASVRMARVRQIHSVDNFNTGAFAVEKSGKAEGSFLSEWKKNTKGWPCKPVVSDHREYFFNCHDEIAFAFVDGSHYYKNAYRDMEACWRHMVRGGILAVHDTACPDVWKAIKDFRKEYQPKVVGRVMATMGFMKI